MSTAASRPKGHKWTWEDWLAAPMLALVIFGAVSFVFILALAGILRALSAVGLT